MKLTFQDGVKRAQADPYMCETKQGWVMYATGVNGVAVDTAENPFAPWSYEG